MTASLKLAMRYFLILSLAIALSTPAYATTFFYSFKCKSNDDNSTMTHESNLQQSNGKDDGNTLGYQAGSFSYLQKGRIAFKDIFGFQEGQNRDPRQPKYQGEAGIFHDMNISFQGAKGISEFYASSSFSDSRISSNNAIRFEEFSRNFSGDFDKEFIINYSAEKIDVNANAIMGNSRRRDFGYDFLYNATVANGVVETKRTMRLANRRDLGKLSWEQNSLMKGNITLDDHVSASNLLDKSYSRI
jgi:hypothetical protein